MKNKEMKRTLIFLTIIFLTNFVGMYYGFYSVWWFDMSLHFFGGLFMAMLMAHYLGDILELRIANYELTTLKKYLIIVGAVSFIGIVWEFAEYLSSQTLIEPLYNNFGIRAYFIGDLDDTINDLLMDVVGTFAWLVIFRKS